MLGGASVGLLEESKVSMGFAMASFFLA